MRALALAAVLALASPCTAAPSAATPLSAAIDAEAGCVSRNAVALAGSDRPVAEVIVAARAACAAETADLERAHHDAGRSWEEARSLVAALREATDPSVAALVVDTRRLRDEAARTPASRRGNKVERTF